MLAVIMVHNFDHEVVTTLLKVRKTHVIIISGFTAARRFIPLLQWWDESPYKHFVKKGG